MKNNIKVEVAYAGINEQYLVTVIVEKDSTIEMAIIRSNLLTKCREIDLSKQKVGIFNEIRQLSDKVQAGDRVEIYRPLLIDPKEARRSKANKVYA